MREMFSGYYPPTGIQLEALWSDAAVVVDANVLLNLYRYSEVSRREFMDVLETLKARLWLPHQVALEFHRNRTDVIRAQTTAFDQVVKILTATDATFRSEVGQFRKIESLSIDDLIQRREATTTELIAGLKSAQKAQTQIPNNPDEDEVAVWVTSLFDGRVGPEYSADELEKIYDDGSKRYANKVPPGFADGKKPEPDRYGDLVLWKQMVQQARVVSNDMIFVTDDRKDDWWRIEGGQTMGPRPELIREFHDETARRIQLYSPQSFLREAQAQVEAQVSQKTYDEVADISERQSHVGHLAEQKQWAASIRRELHQSNPFINAQTTATANLRRMLRNTELQERYEELTRRRARLEEALRSSEGEEEEEDLIDSIVDARLELDQLAEELAADAESGHTVSDAIRRVITADHLRLRDEPGTG